MSKDQKFRFLKDFIVTNRRLFKRFPPVQEWRNGGFLKGLTGQETSLFTINFQGEKNFFFTIRDFFLRNCG